MPINSLARAALYPSLQPSFQVSKVKTVPFQVKRKHKKSKSSKSKSSKKERQASGGLTTSANTQAAGGGAATSEHLDTLRSAQLKPSDLKDGLRLLMLQEGKFWPARLNSTKLPDVYGVVMDRQRGNRPIILPRDDILKEAVSRTHVSPYNFLVMPTEDKSFRVI